MTLGDTNLSWHPDRLGMRAVRCRGAPVVTNVCKAKLNLITVWPMPMGLVLAAG
jgi:hypothetical protein